MTHAGRLAGGILLAMMVGQAEALPAEAARPWLPQRKAADAITQEEWDGMRQIAEHYPVPETAPGVSASGKNYYARYGGGLPRPETWADVTPEHIAKSGEHHLALLCDMPRIYYSDPTKEGREKAKQFFLKQVRLTLDTEDTNSGSGRTYQIVRVGFQNNILAMQDVLKEEGLYDDFARVWSMHKRFMTREHPKENMDWTRDRVTLAWALTANMDDGPEKLHRLRLLQRATSLSYAYLITPDGGAIHHGCDHISYASYSLDEAIGIALTMYGTPFQLANEVYDNLKTCAWAHGLSTMGRDYPGNLCVRVGLGPMDINVQKWLPAMADMTTPPDPLLAGMVLAKFGDVTNGVIAETVARYKAAGIQPYDMIAHHSYNISAAAIHRRGDWLVSIDGCRQPIKGIELYAWPGTPRSFMPYSAFGSIQILTARRGAKDYGYNSAGWDYNHFAGVTAPVLPYELMMTQRKTEQVRSGSTFGGGTSLGANGTWGLIFSRYKQELCRKSAFCFDNRITVLTSDIQPLSHAFATRNPKDASTFPAHTTLFQFALEDPAAPTWIDGKPENTFPYRSELELSRPIRLRDHMGNGYYVHAAPGDTLHTARRTQNAYNFSNLRKDTPTDIRKLWTKHTRPPQLKRLLEHCEPIPGDFGLAWIDHAADTNGSRAAFTLFVQGQPTDGELPYTILQQDRIAHILRDAPSKTTGYVVFEADAALENGPLRSVNRPATVMVQESGDKVLTCSVSSTDAASDAALIAKGDPQDPPFDAEALAPSIVLTFEGTWSLEQAERKDITCTRESGATIITIPYRDYMPVRFGLMQVLR